MDKRDLILNALSELLKEQKGNLCSVSDIAKRAGIAKGGMYYYFRSKEEVLDALVERTYQQIIDECEQIASADGDNAVIKLKSVYQHYRSEVISSELDSQLHRPENAYIHQKSLAKILTSLSPIIAKIIEQGNAEKFFQCAFPLETSEIILSAFCFLLDPGIFQWTPEQQLRKLSAITSMSENALGVPSGSSILFSAT